jgi:hypothetical protein
MRRLALAATAAVLLAGCGAAPTTLVGRQPSASPASTPTRTTPTSTTPTSSVPARQPSGDPYVGLADDLHRRGVEVWFETDLVSAWLSGPGDFQATLDRLGRLARVPGVVGFKVADELGYHDGISTPEQGLAFLSAVHRGLAAVAPRAQVLIDMVVPDLGCLPWLDASGQTCAAREDVVSPAATSDAVTRYLRTGWVDRLDLSTGLLDPTSYAARGLSLMDAQRAAWAHAVALGWPSLTTLQARKALAEPGGFHGSTGTAAADVGVYVDTPVSAGASAVDIWTWRQPYDGAVVSLLPDSLAPNSLWLALQHERTSGVHLVTHMTPSTLPTDPAALAHECDLAATVFSAVFVAAGTG